MKLVEHHISELIRYIFYDISTNVEQISGFLHIIEPYLGTFVISL